MKSLNNKLSSLIFLLILMLGFSCDLEEEPRALVAPESFFSSARDVEVALFGAYGWLQSRGVYGLEMPMYLNLRSDMTLSTTFFRPERLTVDNFTLSATAERLPLMYEGLFRVVSAVNNAIQGADQVGDEVPGVLELRAEARFVRAFTYYHLVRLYGDVSIFREQPGSLQEIESVGRSPESEVYDFIIEDLTFAKESLPNVIEGAGRSRATKGTAAAYLASVYLTLEDYANAYREAKFVIDQADDFGYGLDVDFSDLFDSSLSQSLSGPIFLMDFQNDAIPGVESTNQDFLGLIYAPAGLVNANGQFGFSGVVPSIEVFNTWTDGDYRKEISFSTEALASSDKTLVGPDGILGTDDDIFYAQGDTVPYQDWTPEWNGFLAQRPHIDKYIYGSGNGGIFYNETDNNYIAMRYAEVLLIAAEAAVMGGGGSNAEAIEYINQLRARARGGASGTEARVLPADFTSTLTREDIIEERRIELAFEWKRWYDIKRLQIGDQVFSADGLEPQPEFNASRDYLFPIPQIVRQLNPSIGQNPGY